MGELWRSEHMQLVQLFVQVEAAHDTVDELGKLGVIQFRDVSITFKVNLYCATYLKGLLISKVEF
jgi:V-type H+-transporting ATPase subunit a